MLCVHQMGKISCPTCRREINAKVEDHADALIALSLLVQAVRKQRDPTIAKAMTNQIQKLLTEVLTEDKP